ncbi:MAG: 1-acyl-sn-glycerol-3-phosphate acyltransferase [Pirellulaceae bacterium]|nr:1-acyl-sn-glycerol-3-phosphate acyltransferase [Pirellulaceae bacterium]
MQNIIIEKPYEFIPPHRGSGWPNFIQRFRLIDIYLRRSQGILSYEIRQGERLRASLNAGHGILLTPNHCRPADPIAMGWLARDVNTLVYGMASAHLFHQDRFTGWAIQKMGGFSVYREGMDRQAINTSVEILAKAERPLIIFPEGAVTRTNDKLSALLDGVAFIARSGAKKRKKIDPDGKVVIHPVAIKYLFKGDLEQVLGPVLAEIENRLSWRTRIAAPLFHRIQSVGFALLTLKELEYFGSPQVGTLTERLNGLINRLLHPLEMEWFNAEQEGPVIPRIKALRMKILPDLKQGDLSEDERIRRWNQLSDIYLSQQISSYPPDYLTAQPSVDRLLETVERYEEDLTDAVRVHSDLHAVLEVGEAIEVDTQRDRKAEVDPIMVNIEESLQEMLDRLATESRPYEQ